MTDGMAGRHKARDNDAGFRVTASLHILKSEKKKGRERSGKKKFPETPTLAAPPPGPVRQLTDGPLHDDGRVRK
jgi:hypothetical protein